MKRHIAYLKSVLRHKFFVFVEGWKLRSLLYSPIDQLLFILSLIVHDWDKLMPWMWMPYAYNFYAADGSKIPYDPARENEPFRAAWNGHQKLNKHHYQYWILINDSGVVECLPMPHRHRVEMLADWYGAGRAYDEKGEWTPASARDWYMPHASSKRMHPETRMWVELQLKVPAGIRDRLIPDLIAHRDGKPFKVRL